MFFLPVARHIFFMCYKVAAASLALLDSWTKVNVQRMEILRNWKPYGLVFGFAFQTCKELVRVVIVLQLVSLAVYCVPGNLIYGQLLCNVIFD